MIPLPPPELRRWVGPVDEAAYDNPAGTPLLEPFGIPHAAYASVFDFGCGCGRQARQLLQQKPRPGRYIGIDVHPQLIGWCQEHLTPVNRAFQFLHHDVYSPWYAPGNAPRLAEPFPAEDRGFSLVLANSVFTHLTQAQTEYYLAEVARILSPDGVAYTSWLFFDRASFRFLPHVYALYTDPVDFGRAVLFDREWFLATVRRVGLGVSLTIPPPVPGHQWKVLIVKRHEGMIDRFPVGADDAEWVCGATLKPMADPAAPLDLAERLPPLPDLFVPTEPPQPPAPFGYLTEMETLKRTLTTIETSRAWAIGRAVTSPVRLIKKVLRSSSQRD